MTPTFSVVVPTHDDADVLPRALASLLAQSFADFEVVVVDDGSTDATPDVLAAVGDDRVRTVRLDHAGVCAARNAGIGAARGAYVTFLDSDDEALPHWLERLADLAAARPPLASTGCLHVGPDGRPRRAELPRPLGPLFDGIEALFLAGTFAVRADVLAAAGGYDPALRYSENTELGMRLARWCRDAGEDAVSLSELLVRVHDDPARDYGDAPAAAARLLLDRYPDRFARSPLDRANHFAIVGVAEARAGRRDEARRWFGRAWRANPLEPRHAARWLAASTPALARRAWPT